VGVTWYDTRDTSDRLTFHQFFAASYDGGKTFTRPARVSTVVSRPLGTGNLRPSVSTFDGLEGEMRVSLLSATRRWLAGGDYMGLTADNSGAFHPVWADSRTGTYQVYTARVEATLKPAVDQSLENRRDSTAMNSRPTDVTERVELVADPAQYDAETRELELWLRLRNVSDRSIVGPIRVEIRGFGSGLGEVDTEYAPRILNSTNDETGKGAAFIYDTSLGSSGVLPPGGRSGALPWRSQLRDALRTPHLHVYVTGRIR